MDRIRIGKDAENAALRFLMRQGLTFVEHNFHCLGGEIDLIMLDELQLVFVEVRKRKSKHFGSAALSITPRKQEKIILAAQHFLAAHPQYANVICRFDVVTFDGAQANSQAVWYKDAFRP